VQTVSPAQSPTSLTYLLTPIGHVGCTQATFVTCLRPAFEKLGRPTDLRFSPLTLIHGHANDWIAQTEAEHCQGFGRRVAGRLYLHREEQPNASRLVYASSILDIATDGMEELRWLLRPEAHDHFPGITSIRRSFAVTRPPT